MRPKVLLDANVLWSPQQRNLILQVAVQDVVVVHWTNTILDEWLRNVSSDQRAKMEANTLPLMWRHFPDALIPSAGEMELGSTAEGDRHVAAAALSIAPCILLTWNVIDFDMVELGRRSVSVETPDDMLTRLLEQFPTAMDEIVHQARANLNRSAPTSDAYMAILLRNRMHKFVARLAAGHEPANSTTNVSTP